MRRALQEKDRTTASRQYRSEAVAEPGWRAANVTDRPPPGSVSGRTPGSSDNHPKLIMSSRIRKLETVREDGDERVIGESSVAMSAGCDVRDAAAAIAFNGPWTVHRNRVAAETVHDSGVDGDDVPGTAETVAGTESIANGNAFHATAEAERKMTNARNGVGKSAAEKILVGDGHDGFASAGTKRGNAVGIGGIEKPRTLEIEHGMHPDLTIGLRGESKAPTAIARLKGLIGNSGDVLSIEDCGAFAIADASGNFQAAAHGDVAVAFSRWTENP